MCNFHQSLNLKLKKCGHGQAWSFGQSGQELWTCLWALAVFSIWTFTMTAMCEMLILSFGNKNFCLISSFLYNWITFLLLPKLGTLEFELSASPLSLSLSPTVKVEKKWQSEGKKIHLDKKSLYIRSHSSSSSPNWEHLSLNYLHRLALFLFLWSISTQSVWTLTSTIWAVAVSRSIAAQLQWCFY